MHHHRLLPRWFLKGFLQFQICLISLSAWYAGHSASLVHSAVFSLVPRPVSLITAVTASFFIWTSGIPLGEHINMTTVAASAEPPRRSANSLQTSRVTLLVTPPAILLVTPLATLLATPQATLLVSRPTCTTTSADHAAGWPPDHRTFADLQCPLHADCPHRCPLSRSGLRLLLVRPTLSLFVVHWAVFPQLLFNSTLVARTAVVITCPRYRACARGGFRCRSRIPEGALASALVCPSSWSPSVTTLRRHDPDQKTVSQQILPELLHKVDHHQ